MKKDGNFVKPKDFVEPKMVSRKKMLGKLGKKEFSVKCGPCADACTSGTRCK